MIVPIIISTYPFVSARHFAGPVDYKKGETGSVSRCVGLRGSVCDDVSRASADYSFLVLMLPPRSVRCLVRQGAVRTGCCSLSSVGRSVNQTDCQTMCADRNARSVRSSLDVAIATPVLVLHCNANSSSQRRGNRIVESCAEKKGKG